MLEQHHVKGAADACAHFGLKLANVPGVTPGLFSKAKAFGMGQVDAAKSLFHNLRGGLGGQMNPAIVPDPGLVPSQSMDIARATHRHQALGNLKTLAPSLLAGGALYMLHRRKQQQQEQARQQAMMQQAMMQPGYGQP